MFDIAVVDFTAPDAPARFTRSLNETGFAVLRGHPIDPTLIDAMYAQWSGFFTGDETERRAWLFDPKRQDGYFPFQSENAKGVPVKDLKQFYHVYPDGRVPPALEATTRRLYADLVGLGRILLGWIQDSAPEAVRNGFSEPLPSMIDGSLQSLLRILHYPAIATDYEPGAVRAAAHEDINLVTLLVTGSEPGLQAKDTRGTWHEVPCDSGMIAVNVGDMLQMASGRYFPSTTHRVVNPAPEHNRDRMSLPLFVHPRPDVRLSASRTAREYLDERLQEIGLKT